MCSCEWKMFSSQVSCHFVSATFWPHTFCLKKKSHNITSVISTKVNLFPYIINSLIYIKKKPLQVHLIKWGYTHTQTSSCFNKVILKTSDQKTKQKKPYLPFPCVWIFAISTTSKLKGNHANPLVKIFLAWFTTEPVKIQSNLGSKPDRQRLDKNRQDKFSFFLHLYSATHLNRHCRRSVDIESAFPPQ